MSNLQLSALYELEKTKTRCVIGSELQNHNIDAIDPNYNNNPFDFNLYIEKINTTLLSFSVMK